MKTGLKRALLTLALLLILAPALGGSAKAAAHTHAGELGNSDEHAGWTIITMENGVLKFGDTPQQSINSNHGYYYYPLSTGQYYLGTDVSLDASFRIEGTVDLCLNGHTLTIGGSDSMGIRVGFDSTWTVNNVLFRLYDEAGGSGVVTGSSNKCGVNIFSYDSSNKGDFEMYGGTISGFGIGVFVDDDASFTMNGGSIYDNHGGHNENGGGVCACGTFTMNGGTISGNSATDKGGGVYVYGTFTMNDGTISDNTATDIYGGTTKGGGVYVYGTFTMTGGMISGNTATNGGDVYVGSNNSTFTMTGGTVVGEVSGTVTSAVAVTLFANNGTDTSMTQYVPSNVSTALTANPFTYAGHTFAGWNTEADGSGDAVGASVMTSENLWLYAQWTAIPTPVVPSASSSSPPPEPFSQPLTSAVPSSFDGGKVAVSPADAGIGDKVTLTATPDEGMRLASLTVDRIGGDPVKLTDEGNNVYSFRMPGWRVAIDAKFEPVAAEQSAAQPPAETALSQPAPAQQPLSSGNVPNVVLSPQRVTVNGAEAAVEAYNIGGTNYFSLRDLAALLSGTPAQFCVEFDADRDAVVITKGAAYDGAVNTGFADRSGRTVPSYQTVFIDGAPVSLTAYNIGGNNFFSLRELAAYLGYGVDYNAETNTAVIESR